MGEKERLRSKILEMVKQGQMTLKACYAMLRISYWQSKRLYAAYKEEGDAGLIHGNYGRRSNNSTAERTVGKAVRAYRERYRDFGPTFAAEKLAEIEGIQMSVSGGIPQALYCDRKNAFVLTREPSDAEIRNCVLLVFRPSLMANLFLEKTYLPKMNRNFPHPAARPDDAHVQLRNTNLKDIMYLEYERTVANNYVIRFETRLFQILKTKKTLPRPKDKVTIASPLLSLCGSIGRAAA